MSPEDNKALVRRSVEEGWNKGDLAVIDEVTTPDFVNHDPAAPAVRTREDYKRWVTEIRSAFPDIHFTIDDMIAEGEKVVDRWTMRFTNTGDIVTPEMRIPATGKQIVVSGITINRFVGGKAVESWTQRDMLGYYQQIGLIPVPQPVG